MKKISLVASTTFEQIVPVCKISCIDVRKKSNYTLLHFANSINLNIHLFGERLFEFPPAIQPISIVYSEEQEGVLSEFLDNLIARGYLLEYCIKWVDICEELKEELLNRNLVVEGDLYHIIFAPNPSLVQHIDYIEKELVERENNINAVPELSVLDLGCGSSRDLVYLLKSRSKVQWKGYGIDMLEFCLARSRVLSIRANVTQHLSLYYLEISKDGTFQELERTKDIENSKLYKKLLFDMETEDKKEAFCQSQPCKNFFETCANKLPKTYNLIINIRFINKAFLPSINPMLSPGGFVFISTFAIGSDLPTFSKPKSNHCVDVGELYCFFSVLGYKIVLDVIETIEDGRPVNTFIAQKPFTLSNN
ncbi:hypothetical protein BB561_004878 [Smittium simulii]|uniref:Methyltransferase domain-containing protein n=1 Tax=Smittium simulii TaxID=133385 RepID=A0A2T9YDL5_9FUNG|nr:hypothetical protein BB561_004878 [Smittium simulii]